MEDLYYFTKSNVDLSDIKRIAKNLYYPCTEYTRTHDQWLNIYFRETSFWQWSRLDESEGDFEGFEMPQQHVINRFQPTSAFLIEHHVDSKYELVSFLRLVLEKYGGWVGCNDGNFGTVYTLENIKDLDYPF